MEKNILSFIGIVTVGLALGATVLAGKTGRNREIHIRDLSVVAERGIAAEKLVSLMGTVAGTSPSVYTSSSSPNVYTGGSSPNVYTSSSSPNVYTSSSSPNVYTGGSSPNVYTRGFSMNSQGADEIPMPKLNL